MLIRFCSTKSKGPHTRPTFPLRGVEMQKPREPGRRLRRAYIVSIRSGGVAPAPPMIGKGDGLASAPRLRLRPDLLVVDTPAPSTAMPDSSKSTTAVIRALLDQMAEALTKPKPQPGDEGSEFIPPPSPRRRTRVNVREFLRGQRGKEEESWWDSGSDGDPLIGLRPPRKRRGPSPRR